MFASDRVNGSWLGMYYGQWWTVGAIMSDWEWDTKHDVKNPRTQS